MWVLEQMRANTMRDAAGLLAWRGYDNVRAEELARVARISVGTLYRHYGNKQGFAREVRRFTEQLLSRVGWDAYSRANLGAEPDYRRAFHAFWWELACFALGQPALFCFAFLHWHPDEDSPPQARGGQGPTSAGVWRPGGVSDSGGAGADAQPGAGARGDTRRADGRRARGSAGAGCGPGGRDAGVGGADAAGPVGGPGGGGVRGGRPRRGGDALAGAGRA